MPEERRPPGRRGGAVGGPASVGESFVQGLRVVAPHERAKSPGVAQARPGAFGGTLRESDQEEVSCRQVCDSAEACGAAGPSFRGRGQLQLGQADGAGYGAPSLLCAGRDGVRACFARKACGVLSRDVANDT
ncbi:hypothetical protein GA0115259_1001711 [Streptomyces sp. MnatMP-M17]|nr:hypothetical protein GA0115259_1001711 [Streptomyces sp. MnatMP-M17]